MPVVLHGPELVAGPPARGHKSSQVCHGISQLQAVQWEANQVGIALLRKMLGGKAARVADLVRGAGRGLGRQQGSAMHGQAAHWEVVADQVPVALLRVELDGEAARVTEPLRGAGQASN